MKPNEIYDEVWAFLDDYIQQARYDWGEHCVDDRTALALKEMLWHFERNFMLTPFRDEEPCPK